MFRKLKAIRDCARSRVSAVKQKIDDRISEMKEKINSYLITIFPPEYRRLAVSVSWVIGRFFYEFFSILWGVASWFGNLLLRIATYWQVVFWNRGYRSIFAKGSFFSLSAAYILWAPEFLLIIFLLLIVPFFFACLCAIAAGAVVKFICLFFEYMPLQVLFPVVAFLVGIVVMLATLKTVMAWSKRKEAMHG